MKTTSDGTVYMVGKTRAETTLCATNKDRPQHPVLPTHAGRDLEYLPRRHRR